MFPLRIGLIKSRFYYFRGQKPQFSWFLNVLTCFWASEPVLFNFGKTWIPQRTLESIWKHPGKNITHGNLRPKNFEKIWNINPQFFLFVFCIYLLDPFVGYIFWIYIFKIILGRWGIENYTFFIIKQHPNLNLNFVCVKKHEP